MATDFFMPRPDQQQIHYHTFYTNQNVAQSTPRTTFQSQNYPQISPLSTSNSSITAADSSPQSPTAHHARRVRPLYMPAVLRPNEHPSKPQRTDPSRCEPTSAAAAGAGAVTADTAGTSAARPNSSYLSLAGLGALSRLRRRSTDESRKTGFPEDSWTGWDLELFPTVTAMPTRKHWKLDSDSTICDEPTCKRYFGYFTRRHHCRRCGNIFCDDHSSKEIPLDQKAEYNPRAPAASRSCNHCYSEYSAWRSRTNSQASSTASSEASLHMLGRGHQRTQSHNMVSNTGSSPIVASPAAIDTPNPMSHVGSPDTAASVPRNWNWSTF